MGVSLVAGGKVIGVLHVGSLTPREFTSDDVELLQLAAGRAATAVASLMAQEDRVAAAALQRSLLPSAAEVLARLDAKMQHFEPGAVATVAYAVVDPGLEKMHLCSAGHYPPVIASPGRPAELADIPPGLLIGAPPARSGK